MYISIYCLSLTISGTSSSSLSLGVSLADSTSCLHTPLASSFFPMSIFFFFVLSPSPASRPLFLSLPSFPAAFSLAICSNFVLSLFGRCWSGRKRQRREEGGVCEKMKNRRSQRKTKDTHNYTQPHVEKHNASLSACVGGRGGVGGSRLTSHILERVFTTISLSSSGLSFSTCKQTHHCIISFSSITHAKG